MIPYARQGLEEEDIQAVVQVLRSEWLTTGPMVERFEEAVAQFTRAKYAVAVSSGTAALHATMHAAGIGPGDEVIVPAMTFAATANAVVFQGGVPRFADVHPDTLLMDPTDVEAKITPRTKAIVAVDYAGQPADYDALRAIADRHHLLLSADACHSLGARCRDRRVGTLADVTVLSFHPVKHITTGEGGMVVTDRSAYASAIRRFRNHGFTSDARDRAANNTWRYDMPDLGYNYRITDFQCALGVSQLRRLPGWLERRREIARRYDGAFAPIPQVRALNTREGVSHAYHLYVVRVPAHRREAIFERLRLAGVGVNVHYLPVHLLAFYRQRFGTSRGMCPRAEGASDQILSLPMFPALTEADQTRVIQSVLAETKK